MFWYDKLKYRVRILRWGLFLGILGLGTTGCIDTSQTTGFDTHLISVNQVLDSCFSHGLDSIQSISKTVNFADQKPETKQFTDYNIQEDLDMLRKYDVATPRWADFVETSQRDSAGMTVIDYTVSNKRAPVRSMTFFKEGDQLKALKVFAQKKSVVSQQSIHLEWILESGYTIINESKLIFRKPGTFTMEVVY